MKKDKWLKIGSVALFVTMWMLFLYKKCGIYFDTNDDRIISEILSGAMTGHPDGHVFYLNPILSFPLAFLYRVTAVIPWYGLFLTFMQWFCWILLLYGFLFGKMKEKSIWYRGLACVVCLSMSLYLIANIQFTSTAAFLAITGYLVFVLLEGSKWRIPLFVVCEALGYGIRDKSMLMIQLMGVVFAITVCLFQKWDIKKICSEIVILVISIATILVVGGAVHGMVYLTNDGWREYEKMNEADTELRDYYGLPDYELVKPILDKYGVTETQYVALLYYTWLDPKISGDCLQELAEYSETLYSYPTLSEVVKGVFSSYVEKCWKIGTEILVLYLAAGVLLVLYKNWRVLWMVFGVFFSRCALMSYLVYGRRLPERVIFSIYFAEMIFLFVAILFCIHDKKLVNWICLGVMTLALGITYKESFPYQYDYVVPTNEVQGIFVQGLREIHAYCDSHPDSHFLLESGIMHYYRGSAFENEIYGPGNEMITGTWYFRAPGICERLEEWQQDGKDLCLILSPELEGRNPSIIRSVEELYQGQLVLEDSFQTSPGTVYDVYKLQ